MNEIIPPSGEWERARLERKADALLEAAGEEARNDWPACWPRREESEFERIAAAHTGMVPLVVTPLVAALPSFDPEAGCQAMRGLMQERPGAEASDLLSEILDETAEGTSHGSGFSMERRSFPPERCRWHRCNEPLYAAGASCKPGRPRKYCDGHQKPAKARTRRLRRNGVNVGMNRNLVYDFVGLKEQELAGYRQIWATVNSART
ncbi:hypothetical protein [Streptomyces sp. NBC_01439]|uniref:hypothetical protein n=1 Tax=Streptomyces sp. NBC_01439 TaxID=2903867 RepID=UPI002E2A9E64|nr:hypothetical protein [Streptomyces sp. NBC_01439]